MRLLPSLSVAFGSLAMLTTAHACTGIDGNADAASSRPPPMAQYTPVERQAAAQQRLQQGQAAANKLYGSDLHQPVPVVTASAEERRAAAQARRAKATALNKAGLLPVSSDLDYPRPAR